MGFNSGFKGLIIGYRERETGTDGPKPHKRHSVCPFVRPSICMERLGYHRTNIYEMFIFE